MHKLFIDDERAPPNDGSKWIICKNMQEVQWWFTSGYRFGFISFDHDLGHNQPTGMDIAKWLVERELEYHIGISFPENFQYYVHSQNPIGKANIEGLLNPYLKVR